MKSRLFGLPEESFVFTVPRKGLITKTETRVISLMKLDLHPGQVLWDIGAGSGSVGIEAARLVPDLKVIAVEKDPADFDCLKKNIEAFGLGERILPIFGKAPEALSEAPSPDRVFIGGSGGRMADLLTIVWTKATNVGIVANFATIENLAEALDWAKRKKMTPDIVHLQVGRGVPIVGLTRIEAQNPVTILTLFPAEALS
jgi:precorrin-6Y C5,15-methyltransferase (decarboxylating), CbiT subunit